MAQEVHCVSVPMPACTDLPPTADEAKPIGAIESGATALLRRLLASPWAALVAFVVIGLVVYSPALNGELIWDDEYLVGQNPFYKSPIFAIEVFRTSFSTRARSTIARSRISPTWSTTGFGRGIRSATT